MYDYFIRAFFLLKITGEGGKKKEALIKRVVATAGDTVEVNFRQIRNILLPGAVARAVARISKAHTRLQFSALLCFAFAPIHTLLLDGVVFFGFWGAR